ncbi:MAG: MaoC family dehydratase [Chloroflexi bacterium]|nr:MaoC family dehydratase [Chloroflexota bacterium]
MSQRPGSLPEATAGQALPAVVRYVTQEKINRYARASGDGNPLHTDPEYAARTRFGGTIAHGLLVLAYVSEMLTAAFGERWPNGGRLKSRFRAPARPGDTLTVSGEVQKADGVRTLCRIEVRNQAGEVLVDGEAEVGG